MYQRLGGTANGDLRVIVVPLAGMALTYFFVNTIPIAIAIALTTEQSAWRIWKTDFASSAPSYLLGRRRGRRRDRGHRKLGCLVDAAAHGGAAVPDLQDVPRRRESEARQGAILEAAHDAIITMDQNLNIREFNPAAEQMFGHRRIDILGRSVELLAARPPIARRNSRR